MNICLKQTYLHYIEYIVFAVVMRLGNAMYCPRPVTSAYLHQLDIKLIQHIIYIKKRLLFSGCDAE